MQQPGNRRGWRRLGRHWRAAGLNGDTGDRIPVAVVLVQVAGRAPPGSGHSIFRIVSETGGFLVFAAGNGEIGAINMRCLL